MHDGLIAGRILATAWIAATVIAFFLEPTAYGGLLAATGACVAWLALASQDRRRRLLPLALVLLAVSLVATAAHPGVRAWWS